MTDEQQIPPSPALAAWIKKREQAIALKEFIREDGGHIILKSTTLNLYELDESLRVEAKAYLKVQWRIED